MMRRIFKLALCFFAFFNFAMAEIQLKATPKSIHSGLAPIHQARATDTLLAVAKALLANVTLSAKKHTNNHTKKDFYIGSLFLYFDLSRLN